MSINKWMDKEIVVHIYNGIFLCHKKEQIWVSYSEVDEPRACYTEWSNSEKQILRINTYMESRKMVLMNLFVGQQQRHRHSEQTCAHSGGRREQDAALTHTHYHMQTESQWEPAVGCRELSQVLCDNPAQAGEVGGASKAQEVGYGWFTLMHGWNHNTVKQLSSS